MVSDDRRGGVESGEGKSSGGGMSSCDSEAKRGVGDEQSGTAVEE
jgi:hypothetical protein